MNLLYNHKYKGMIYMKNMKHILKIVIIMVILILVGIFSLSYTINKNQDYYNNVIEDIKNNYSIDGEITYCNVYGNYYIFTTKNSVVVLNKEYEEILKEDINKLYDNKNNYDLIYKTNKLMYENTVLKNNNVTYEYYDVSNYKKISSTTLEN